MVTQPLGVDGVGFPRGFVTVECHRRGLGVDHQHPAFRNGDQEVRAYRPLAAGLLFLGAPRDVRRQPGHLDDAQELELAPLASGGPTLKCRREFAGAVAQVASGVGDVDQPVQHGGVDLGAGRLGLFHGLFEFGQFGAHRTDHTLKLQSLGFEAGLGVNGAALGEIVGHLAARLEHGGLE